MWSKIFIAGIASVSADNCRNPNIENLAARCNTICETELVKCLADCGSDSACASNCTRDQVACSNGCPCGADCPNGCDGTCSNPFCQSVMVLHTKEYPVPRTPPVKVDYLGHEYRDFNFEMGEIEVRMSCMTEFNGEHYIFGGDVGDASTGDATGSIYQMAKIDGCGLKKMPDLPFSFTQGTCGTYQWTTDTKKVVLCFDAITSIPVSSPRNCHTWDGENFETITGSKQYHIQIRFGTYKGNPIAIGDGYAGHNKVEIMNINTEDGTHTWSDAASWPFRFSYSQYSIISEADRVITFGGHCHYQAPYELDEVTEYKNDEWTLLGRLNRSRFGGAAISNGLEVMILGGTPRNNPRPDVMTESWPMWETGPNDFNSTDTRHGLYQGAYDKWPEVINVPFDFCSGPNPN